MHTNKKLFITLSMAILTSITSPMKLHAMQEGWQNVVAPELKETIISLSPDLKEIINFLAWQPFHTLWHSDPVTSVALADGIIVTTSSDIETNKTKVDVWDRNTYKRITTLKAHTGSVRSIAVANGIIVTGSFDKTAKVWDRNTYKEITTLKGHNDYVMSVAIANGIIVTGSWDKTAKVWDRNTYKEITALKGHTDSVQSIAVANSIIVTGSKDKTAKVWSRKDYKEIATLKGHNDTVSSVAVADGIIITGSVDGTVKAWSRKNYKEITTLKGHTGSISSVAVADGIIVTGSASWNGTAKVWNKKNYKEITTLNNGPVCSVAVADGIIVIGSAHNIAKVYDSKPFAGTAQNNPLLWILAHATIQQWDFIKRAYEVTKKKCGIRLPQECGEIEEDESQEEADLRTYSSFPHAVRQYLRDRLNIFFEGPFTDPFSALE